MRRLYPRYTLSFLLFQSTHPRGMRLEEMKKDHEEQLFQSTHPRGMRLTAASPIWIKYLISIHASAWDATEFAPTNVRCPPDFNPRIRVGCDIMHLLRPTGIITFQSTHPRGMRRAGAQKVLNLVIFQSTHPRGMRLNLESAYSMPM